MKDLIWLMLYSYHLLGIENSKRKLLKSKKDCCCDCGSKKRMQILGIASIINIYLPRSSVQRKLNAMVLA